MSTRLTCGAALIVMMAGTSPMSAAVEPDAPYVPTPAVVVEAMLDLAKVGRGDYVIDLGSGDGRILIAAAKRFDARGFGVDIDGGLVHTARREAQRQGVADRVEFFERDLFTTDIRRATVLTLYLFPRILMQLRPRLVSELAPGTRVVSHDFHMSSWKPDAHITVPVPDKPYGPPSSEVYLWIVPANAEGTWRWRSVIGGRAVDYELELQQRFQMLEGRVRAGVTRVPIEAGVLRGEAIRVSFNAPLNGRTVRHELAGRVSGDTASGQLSLDGAGPLEWTARRSGRADTVLAPGSAAMD
jgi:SAM-dependent methyltransferase